MFRVIFIAACFSISHISFAQNEKFEVEGAIILSNNEDPSPVAGTIRWTGLDFEGFDGSSWKSLTCCSPTNPVETIDFICPSGTMTDPNFLTQVIHMNPTSQVVNYDLYVNGIDTGPSYTYDPSKTIQSKINNLSSILSGTGTATFELFYFYDNDPAILLSAGTCSVNYDFSSSSAIHDCFGFDLIDNINSYVPPVISCIPDQVFTSISALNTKINSMTDHGGAVYQLAGGTYNNSQFGNGIRITDKRNLTLCSDPANPAILDGQNLSNFGIHVREINGTTDNITITGFEITGTKFHGIYLGGDVSSQKTGGNIYVAGNHIYEAANSSGAGITVRNGNDNRQIIIEGNDIERIDPNGSGSGRGEGIYVGQGSNGNSYGNNVILRGNYIHDMDGEAIDIKRYSRNILIEYNRIDNINVFSQGAITLALDRLDGNNTVDANLVVRRNCISNVGTLNSDGEGIVVANGNALVEENLIYNIHRNGIDVYNDADGPGKTVTIKNNIIWNYGGLPVRENVGTGNAGPNNPFTVIRQNNIVDSSPDTNECLETASIFIGPLTSKAGFAPN